MLPTIPSLRQPEYQISNSLRFRSSANAYLQRTPAVQGTRSKWTFSFWVKRGTLGTLQTIFCARETTNNVNSYPFAAITFTSLDQLSYDESYDGGYVGQKITTQVFRDASAWYHIVIALDTTLATPNDRVKLYVNGSQITSFSTSTNPTGYTSIFSSNKPHLVAANYSAPTPTIGQYFDGYLAEVHFIDGQALTPAAFGATSSKTGVWAPKKYLGTYGTNGFYLDFADNSAATSATIGKDRSGNYNSWTPTNISMVAGVNYDSMTDTPTPYGDAAYYSGWNPSYGLQFRSAASTALTRTPSVAGNRQTWTWSSWVKRGSTGSAHTIFDHGPSENDFAIIFFNASDKLVYQNGAGSVVTNQLVTTQAFTNTASWYHVVVACDTTQPVSTNKMKIYVDGVQITSFTTATYPVDNFQTYVNSTQIAYIGKNSPTGVALFNGIIAEINLIDGQALTPAAFGETVDGRWVPKTYSGTYGTNGFYLNFADRSAMTAATIGNDASSNNNQWTPNNMGPTDAIDYGVKTARGNYAVLNPVNAGMASTIFGGNLTFAGISNTNAGHVASTIGVDSGAYYFEFIPSSFTGILEVYLFAGGIAPGSVIVAGYRSNGTKDVDDVNSAYGAAWTDVDHIGCAFNVSTKTVTFYKNNVSQGTFSYVTTGALYPAIAVRGTGSANGYVNFGQRPFAYTPPTGFKTLNTNNLPDPAIVHGHAYMAATTYTGTGVGRNISNFSNNRSFRPDLVWIKSRSNATDHALYDTLRGAQQDLVSSSTAAETTQSTGLTAFREDGFGLSTLTKLNSAGNTYVAWQWKAGDSTVTNTAGSITSQVDAGTTQGVSVVTYTGTGANATVGHGLGVAPKMVIVKSRTTGSWQVRHNSIAAANSIQLNSPNQAAAAATVWNSTAPTSSVFSIGTSTDVNASGVGYVAYCFAEIAGYSKFGLYAGNSSADGPFIHCGFEPKFLMYKGTTEPAANWHMLDGTVSESNVVNEELAANTSTKSITTGPYIDILSNGFKLRTASTAHNLSGNTYIFAAFAEVPSKYALAR